MKPRRWLNKTQLRALRVLYGGGRMASSPTTRKLARLGLAEAELLDGRFVYVLADAGTAYMLGRWDADVDRRGADE